VKKVNNIRICLAAARSRLVDLSPFQGSTTVQILGAYPADESILFLMYETIVSASRSSLDLLLVVDGVEDVAY